MSNKAYNLRVKLEALQRELSEAIILCNELSESRKTTKNTDLPDKWRVYAKDRWPVREDFLEWIMTHHPDAIMACFYGICGCKWSLNSIQDETLKVYDA